MSSRWETVNREMTQTVSFKPVQVIVEAEAALPGGLRDEARVYYAGAHASVKNAEIQNGKIDAEGKVCFKVLYAQGDLQHVIPLEIGADFSHAISLSQDQKENTQSYARVFSTVEDVDVNIHNGRMILRAVIALEGHISCMKHAKWVSPHAEDVFLQKRTIQSSVCQIAGEGEIVSTIRDEIPLSDVLQINETLLGNAHAVVEDVHRIGANQVAVTGTVLLDVCHTSDMPQRPLITTQHKIPFEQEIAVSGDSLQTVSAQSVVWDVAVASQEQEDHDGERVLRCEVQIHTLVQSIVSDEVEFLQDAYTVSGKALELKCQNVCCTQQIVREEKAESSRLTVLLPDGSPRIRQALLGFMNPVILRKKKSGNRLMIDGLMQVTSVYLTDDKSVPISMKSEVPFASAFMTDATEQDHIRLTVSEPVINAVTGDRADIKYILHMTAEGERTREFSVVQDISEADTEQAYHGISVCFVQPGENIWDIAKRYRVSQELVTADNGIRDQPISTGTPLIICHGKAVSAKEQEHA